jgi:two-component system uhpT operon response regulator UhpA
MPTRRDQSAVAPHRPGIRLAIVDDQQMVLSALHAWLGQADADIGVVIAAPSWAGLISHPAFPVDVVLLDLDLGDDIPAPVKISTLRQAGVAVIMISNLADPARIKACLAAGAASYLPKSEPAEEILRAVCAAWWRTRRCGPRRRPRSARRNCAR